MVKCLVGGKCRALGEPGEEYGETLMGQWEGRRKREPR